MKLKEIENRVQFNKSKSLTDAFEKLRGIITALNKRDLSDEITLQVNKELEALNNFNGPEKKILLQIKNY